MLPVQTVMIRYMVLVYRWGRGWLGAVGARDGFAGGTVTGGGARWRGGGGGKNEERHCRTRVRKGPADVGVGGA